MNSVLKKTGWILLIQLGVVFQMFGQTNEKNQTSEIKGRVYDALTNESIPFANVAIQDTDKGAVTDIDGNYVISNLEPGLYNIQASFVGYEIATIFEIEVFRNRPTDLDIGMNATSAKLQTVEVTTEVYERNTESPISLQTIGTNEIQRNPGGNRDVSRALQSLPGVSSTLSFRNDIIIRGGAPSENRFYLDGIEVPVINHFATQGSSGGPVGIINVNFIEQVDLYSGAFPANRGNALSSVLEFVQKDGNTDGLKTNITFGSSDLGITMDGPLGEKTTFIASARRSYLQLLFGVLGLPFLPTYNDAQFKVKHKFNNKNELSIIGLGAFDTFDLNPSAVDDAETEAERQEAAYTLAFIPTNEQWNYTIGANYKHFGKTGFQNVVVSRSHLNNTALKYEDNDDSDPANLILNYASQEIENKIRLENTQRIDGWRINMGVNLDDVTYTNSTFNQVLNDDTIQSINFNSEINLQEFGIFGQVTKTYIQDRLALSFGLRTDWNNYSDDMSNPLEQLSPRFSATFSITPEFSVSGNIGRYYQLPPYTVLGYRDNNEQLVNKENGVTYISNDQVVLGFAYEFKRNTRVTVEGFYKVYDQYPFTLRDSVNLANLGADFGVIGNEPVVPIGEGRAYGLEFSVQRKLYNGLFGIASLTLVRSEFTDKNGDFAPSSWDNRFILSITGGKKFGKNWEFGARLGVLGGAPFTPFDVETTALKQVWDAQNRGVLNYDEVNTERNPLAYQLNVRLDKKYFFDKWSINFYLDIENVTNASVELQSNLDTVKDAEGNSVTDPNDPSRYLLTTIPNTAGILLPSIGLVVEF